MARSTVQGEHRRLSKANAQIGEETIKLTLITNLSFVEKVETGIRLHAYALLVEQEAPGIFSEMNRARGFLTDGALPVFDVHLSALPFPIVLSAKEGGPLFIGCDGKERQLFSGALLGLAGGEQFYLNLNDNSQPLDVLEFDSYDKVWETLPKKVAQYWRAPNMPIPHWYPAEVVRLMIGQEG